MNEDSLKMVIFGFFFIFTCILFPEIYNTINNLDTSGWDFIGSAGVITILPAIPYILIVLTLIPFLYVLRENL